MYIPRTIEKKIKELSLKYPVITLTGPRQSGKSTLLQKSFPDYAYVSLEDPDIRLFAEEDPRSFLETYPEKTILDEVQRVPSLFSYLQTHVDRQNREGLYLLAGSHNFLLMQKISQSLAGRTAILKLLPFSHEEMRTVSLVDPNTDIEIFNGSYPRLYDKKIFPTDFYPYYLQTYIERDVQQIKNIGNLNKFVRFIKLCAGRIGQLLNLSSLANDCDIAVSTAQQWISVLEASYVIYLLPPNHKNYSKRVVKTPKLYFHDTGLACSLLSLTSSEQLINHYHRGALFENLVINEFFKFFTHRGMVPPFSFWRDKTGNEIDLIIEFNNRSIAIEIKSGKTLTPQYFSNLKKWSKLSETPINDLFVIYNGNQNIKTANGNLLAWQKLNINTIVKQAEVNRP
ncbi:ATP-binding protein [Thermophagus xiamenensis]|uniref:AAA+ ATPase domain-containing protein n=1 Tax=Thermophagus xiamenensis TaxID=385682 RepID=A0A1I2ER96_9BACT|nr:ATP-binding protein [Thermophagus xiamenensis]SFE95355.1 hypothetical protein SAMN05444380_1248 [Thermophagus xiamenensis]